MDADRQRRHQVREPGRHTYPHAGLRRTSSPTQFRNRLEAVVYTYTVSQLLTNV
jgi:Ca2+-binding EF-hand superfamily protein